MNEIQFMNWLMSYFSLGLGCPGPVIYALFFPQREVKYNPPLIRQLLQYFNDAMVTMMTNQSHKGWIRIVDPSSLSTSPQWQRANYTVTHMQSAGYRLEYDTFAVESLPKDDPLFITMKSYIGTNGIKICCQYINQSIQRIAEASFSSWIAHLQIQEAIDVFCKHLDNFAQSILIKY
jgi:hypothetical protein